MVSNLRFIDLCGRGALIPVRLCLTTPLEQSVFDLSGDKVRFLVVESGCVYHDEAGYPDLIHAGVRVGNIGKSSWRYEVGLFRNNDNKTFAEGFFAQVQVSAHDNAPLALTSDFRACLEIINLA